MAAAKCERGCGFKWDAADDKSWRVHLLNCPGSPPPPPTTPIAAATDPVVPNLENKTVRAGGKALDSTMNGPLFLGNVEETPVLHLSKDRVGKIYRQSPAKGANAHKGDRVDVWIQVLDTSTEDEDEDHGVEKDGIWRSIGRWVWRDLIGFK